MYQEYDDYDSIDDFYDDYDSIDDYADWICDCDICTGKVRHLDNDIGKYEDYEPEEEIKEEPERQDFTCNTCVSVHYCEYAWDDFNVNGKCLAH